MSGVGVNLIRAALQLSAWIFMREIKPKGGVVYFLRAGRTQYWKIGFCLDEAGLSRRINTLQTGCPHKLNLIAIKRNCDFSDETYCHQQLISFWMHGEWFKYTPFIDDLITGWKITEVPK